MSEPAAGFLLTKDALDVDRWNKLLALQEAVGNDSFLDEVVNLFLQESPRRSVAMRSALTSQDAAEIEQQAHSLKGSASNVGAARVMQVAAEIEKLATERHFERAGELIELVDPELDRARAEFVKHGAKLT